MTDVAEPRQLDAEDFLVEKQQRRKRLLMRRGRQVALVREVGEKGDDLARTHIYRMPLAVEQHVAAHPLDVRLLRSDAVMLVADTSTYLVEQPRSIVAVVGVSFVDFGA
jgi:hypothetical protein